MTTKKTKTKESFNLDYAPALESTKIVKIKPKYGHFINGEFVEPKSKKYFDTYNPATAKLHVF